MSGKTIREYVDDYIKYYPEKWRWSLKNSIAQRKFYPGKTAEEMFLGDK